MDEVLTIATPLYNFLGIPWRLFSLAELPIDSVLYTIDSHHIWDERLKVVRDSYEVRRALSATKIPFRYKPVNYPEFHSEDWMKANGVAKV